jgi:hypothetical protein
MPSWRGTQLRTGTTLPLTVPKINIPEDVIQEFLAYFVLLSCPT